jgi:hypothetical protein
MRQAFTVRERFERWVGAQDPGHGVVMYRRVFASIWVVYDVIDLAFGMTERARIWFPHERDSHLLALQSVLIVSGAMLALGKGVWAFGVLAALARTTEALRFFALNDFFFASVVLLLLAHSEGGPFAKGQRPRWVRDALLLELGWVYLATGILKLNPDWLGGGHLFVRTQYLAHSEGWPYGAALEHALGLRAVDARLAALGCALELTLAAVLFARRPYWLAAALVLGIHAFGAFITNVWFFSASMAAGVLLLLPRGAVAESSSA